MMIRAGSTLLVPRPVGLSRDVTLRIADNGQLSLSREVVLRRTIVKAGKNDTVASMAKRYRVNAASVADWNKVSTSASFKPEQQVVMYLPAQQNRGARKPSRTGTKVASHGKPAKAKPTQVARR
jgi:membrane-bound lytic murein transglycosylase D